MSARAWSGFAALSLLWGVPYLFIKVAVDGGMSPAFIAWVRVVLAAVILLALAKRAGVLSSLRGHWPWLAVYALVKITIPFPLIAVLSPPKAMPDADVLASLAILGIACTALAFVILAALVSEIGPGRALVITYVNPVVAVALGVVVLGEHVGPGAVAGLLLIIARSWLSTDGRLPPGLVAIATRRRERRRAAAQSPLSPAIRRSKPAGA